MIRHWDRAYWATLLIMSVFALGFALAVASSVSAETTAGRRAAREAAKQRDLASDYRSPSVVVDGTPRPLGDAPTFQAPKNVGRGANQIKLVPNNPDTRPMRSLTTVIGEAGMEAPLGGDDVIVAASNSFSGSPLLQIASDGTSFAAIQTSNSVQVYRSTDGGETWPLWSTFVDPGTSFIFLEDFVVAEGDADRVFIAYNSGLSPKEVRLANADIAAAIPTWAIVTVLADVGIEHGVGTDGVDIATDAASYPDYFVYVVAQSNDGNGDDIWFARSTSQGSSFSAGYRIADSTAGFGTFFRFPKVSFGTGDMVHAVFRSEATPSSSRETRHRRVPFWANGGVAAWGAVQTLSTETGGLWGQPHAMNASTANGTVLVSMLFFGTGGGHKVRYSTDSGASWPAAHETPTGLSGSNGVEPLILPSGDIVMASFELSDFAPRLQIELARSSIAGPGAWAAPQGIAIHEYSGALGRLEGLASDPTRSNRIAALWMHFDGTSDVIRFDAEWRRDPGYGNTEVGFPVNPTNFGQTPPAIAELDGDPFGEIVFGTLEGDIFVYDHLGNVVPGWPVNIGSMPIDAPVAIGKLTTGPPAIVAGTADGQVYAFDPDGNTLPGWPVQLTNVADTYVSIGALGPPEGRYVVAVAGDRMHVLRHDGSTAQTWQFTQSFTRPAAIGDVNNDGVAELVTLKGEWFHVNQLGTNATLAFRRFVGEPTSDAPTLADLDLDGDLEIAVPTTVGKLYVLNHDGTDYPGWPQTVISGSALTAVSFADILPITAAPELIFAERDGTGRVHVYLEFGGDHVTSPQTFGSGNVFMPPIIDDIAFPTIANISMANSDIGYSTSGAALPATGWPRNLPGIVEETFASGDIDNDGRNEIVVLGVDFLTVFDVGEPETAIANRRWRMYGHDAQRTGCLDCAEIATGIGDTPPESFAGEVDVDVYPNPFNPVTTISYNVAKDGPVTLEVFDVAGRRVATLLRSEFHTADRYSITYEPNVATGVYLVRLESGGEVVTRKINLLK